MIWVTTRAASNMFQHTSLPVKKPRLCTAMRRPSSTPKATQNKTAKTFMATVRSSVTREAMWSISTPWIDPKRVGGTTKRRLSSFSQKASKQAKVRDMQQGIDTHPIEEGVRRTIQQARIIHRQSKKACIYKPSKSCSLDACRRASSQRRGPRRCRNRREAENGAKNKCSRNCGARASAERRTDLASRRNCTAEGTDNIARHAQ